MGSILIKYQFTDNITYNKFLEEVKEDNVDQISIYQQDNQFLIKSKINHNEIQFKVYNIQLFLKHLDQCSQKVIQIEFIEEEVYKYVNYIKNILHVIPLFLVFQQFAQLKNMTQGKNQNMIQRYLQKSDFQFQKNQKNISFDDIAGNEQAKIEMQEFFQFFTNNKKFIDIGANIPKGALLAGPPGTGKTLLAKAVSSQSNVNFLYVSGSEFVQVFVGMGAYKIRQLFKEARKNSPCIIFIDEIDSIGKKRGQEHNEVNNTLNQLLVELDGFSKDQNVVVIGATNRKDLLDDALLRPGRLERIIDVELPDQQARESLFQIYLKKFSIDPSIKFDDFCKKLSSLTYNMSGADIKNVCNEAGMIAVKRKAQYIQQSDLNESIERILGGILKKQSLNEQEIKQISLHESGHVIASWFLEYIDPIIKVSIKQRSKNPLGFKQFIQKEQNLQITDELKQKIIYSLSGRTAEKLFSDYISNGAQDDLQNAYKIARQMTSQLGMNQMENVTYEENDFSKSYSDQTNFKIDQLVKKLIKEMEEQTIQLLRDNQINLFKVQKALIDKQTLYYEDLEEILGKNNKQNKNMQIYQQYKEL